MFNNGKCELRPPLLAGVANIDTDSLTAWCSALQAGGEDPGAAAARAAEDRGIQISREFRVGEGQDSCLIMLRKPILTSWQVAEQNFTADTLKQISDLIGRNPEYYTIWNYRRQALRHRFLEAENSTEENASLVIADLIRSDLTFLIPLLRSFPKCYWIWNYRLWLLDEARRLLPLAEARPFWEQELALVGKMLTLDSRNFHGWGYRRLVVETIRQLGTPDEAKSMTQKEVEYAKKMVGANLSNFSAWHYRTKLILRILEEQSASNEERRKMLDEGEFFWITIS